MPSGSTSVLPRQRLPDRGQQLAPKHRHDHPYREQKAVADGLPLPVRGPPPACHETVHVRMQHQGLTPGVQRGEDARLRARDTCGSASKVRSVSRTA